jgi:hypothetical protein
MFVIALELRPAFKKYCQNHKLKLKNDELTLKD